METENEELYKLLIGCLKKDAPTFDNACLAALTSERWQDLLALAAMQRVTSLLWYRLKQKNLETLIPKTAATSLKEAFRRNTLNNLRLNGELRLLLSALKDKDIPVILLKGIVLANTVYPNISLREMNDIDVLVQPENLERIAAILIGMGYHPMQAINLKLTIQTNHHLPGFIKKRHAKIEVHWNITRPNKNYSIEPYGIWERAVPVQIFGCSTLMFSPEDLLLHICLHTSYLHSFSFGLRPFCDIAEMIDHFGSDLNWEIVVDRACAQGWQRGVYLALRVAAELTGAPLPEDVLEKLRPANMSETILKTVHTQIFTDKYFAQSIPQPFAKLLESGRLGDKLKIFWQRVFLPKALIANNYSVSIDSPRIYLCYLRRFYDVLRRHGRTFKKFQQNDDAVKSMVERKTQIADWMD